MWDLKGKALGVPVYEMLGGRTRDRVKLYANGWYRQGMSPAEFAEAAEKTISLGFKGLKFNPWGGREGIDFLAHRDPDIARRVGYKSFLSGHRGAMTQGGSEMMVKRDHLLAGWGNYQLRYFFS